MAIDKIYKKFLMEYTLNRSFSGLRRLKLWTRASMTEERLSGLAMLMVHRNSDVIPSPVDVYGKKSNWRMS